MNVNFRNFAIWLVILFMLMGLFQVFQSSTRNVAVSDKTYSDFISARGRRQRHRRSPSPTMSSPALSATAPGSRP